jgi:hypothetical protein
MRERGLFALRQIGQAMSAQQNYPVKRIKVPHSVGITNKFRNTEQVAPQCINLVIAHPAVGDIVEPALNQDEVIAGIAKQQGVQWIPKSVHLLYFRYSCLLPFKNNCDCFSR